MAVFPHTKDRLHTLLRWSEKYTKTDMVYFASGGGWSAFGTVVTGLLGLATATAFANLLPQTTYGTYQYVLSALGLLGILGLPGMKTAISYATARGADASFFDAIRAKIRWSFLSSLASLGLAGYYLFQGNQLLAGCFVIVSIFLPWWDVFGNYVPYLQGKKRFSSLTLYEAGAQFVNAAAIIAAIALTDNLIVLFIAFFLSWTVGRLYFYRRALKIAPPNDTKDSSIVSYGKHLSVMSILSTIASNADKFLLWHFLGPIQVAVYTFSLTIPLRISSIFATLNRLYFPKVAEQEFSNVKHTLFRKIFFISILTITATAAYIFAAPYIFDIFFPAYKEAVPYTYIAALLIATQPFSLIATALSAHAKKKELYVYNLLPPLVQIGLLVVLIPHFHIYGAVAALVGAQFFENILLIYIVVRSKNN